MNRRLTTVLTCLLLGAGLLVAAAPAQAAGPKITLNSMGARHVSDPISITGYLLRAGSKHDKTILLQRRLNGAWHPNGRLTHRASGKFRFPSRHVHTPQTARWRVLVKSHGKVLDRSNLLAVRVVADTCGTHPSPTTCPQPPDRIQHRDVTDAAICDPANGGGTVTTHHQIRHQPYVWNPTTLEWEPGDPLEWGDDPANPPTTVSVGTDVCPAPAADVLPNLVVKDLNVCSPAEQAKSQVGCFRVEPFTEPDGTTVQLLKFPATTFNIGAGAMEVRSHRDNPGAGITSWNDTLSVQRVYDDHGGFRDIDITSKIDFYWEDEPNGAPDSHGHHHWHIFDFDSYTDNGSQDVQQKHGFCISSSGTTGPSLPGAGVLDPNYDDANACGFGQPDVSDIIHGLSPLYGDTYPSSLEDQGINITAQVDGNHHVQVCADQHNVLLESNENDNCATADVTVAGGVVTAVTNSTGF